MQARIWVFHMEWGSVNTRIHFQYRRLGGAQTGNRFVSFVRAYGLSGCLVELDLKSCAPYFSLFPFGLGELSLFPVGLGSFPFSLVWKCMKWLKCIKCIKCIECIECIECLECRKCIRYIKCTKCETCIKCIEWMKCIKFTKCVKCIKCCSPTTPQASYPTFVRLIGIQFRASSPPNLFRNFMSSWQLAFFFVCQPNCRSWHLVFRWFRLLERFVSCKQVKEKNTSRKRTTQPHIFWQIK